MSLFSGSDLIDFLQGIVDDVLYLGDADLLWLAFRLLLVFFAVIVLVTLLKALYRLFWDTFGGLFSWLWRMVTAPYRIPRDTIQKALQNRRYRKEAQKREKEQKQRLQAEALQREEQEKRELEAFQKIMDE